jgi:hypothetical protein
MSRGETCPVCGCAIAEHSGNGFIVWCDSEGCLGSKDGHPCITDDPRADLDLEPAPAGFLCSAILNPYIRPFWINANHDWLSCAFDAFSLEYAE